MNTRLATGSLALVLLTATTVTACGGGDDEAAAPTPAPPVATTAAPTTAAPDVTTAAPTPTETVDGPAFEVVDLLDDAANDGGIAHKGNSTVTGIAFSSLTQGSVSLSGADATSSEGGAIEALTGPTTVGSIAFPGFGKGPSKQNLSFYGLQQGPAGLVALSSFGEDFVSSADGITWKETGLSAPNGPNIAHVWLSPDTTGTWHLMDDVGNVWISKKAPSPTTVWTRTWQPEGSDPDPTDLPPGACPNSFHQTYYAADQQDGFFASSDGKTMMYGNGLKDYPAGVCRSVDGGKTFKPVAFPKPPAAGALSTPYALVFFDDLHGFAARANDLVAGSAWVYTTSDGGASWTKGTLPPEISSKANLTAGFTAPDGRTAWLVGFGASQPILLKSTDAGVTWTNISESVQAVGLSGNGVKLHTGFALDADNIWLGGEKGTLLYSKTGGE